MPAAGKLELLAPAGIGAVRPGADLAALVLEALLAQGTRLIDGDVLVIAQKAVSKAEDRYARLEGTAPSAQAAALASRCGKDPRWIEVVLSETNEVLRAAPGVLIVEDRRGLVLANAGVDRSNVDQDATAGERVLRLPEDPDASASRLRARFAELSGVDVGVIINDSLGRAWRLGTVGTAIGVSGLPALLDRRGASDLQGRPLEMTEVGLADELAAAASVLMGQAAEGRPVVLIRGLDWPRRDGTARELQRRRSMDLFR